SIILPVHNASSWLQECLQSVLEQDFHGNMELSIFNDASKDDSGSIIEKWTPRLENRGIAIVTSGHNSIQPKGVGYAKNQAVSQSRGKYLCFLDAIIGCQVRREPEGSTERYTRWINGLTQSQLLTQFTHPLELGGCPLRYEGSEQPPLEQETDITWSQLSTWAGKPGSRTPPRRKCPEII
ncbi:UDP-GlcNAc:betaGal beta-1,3-N-acetylglucosaminyltransferase-like protein 1, partial [Acipenser ruthenus]